MLASHKITLHCSASPLYREIICLGVVKDHEQLALLQSLLKCAYNKMAHRNFGRRCVMATLIAPYTNVYL